VRFPDPPRITLVTPSFNQGAFIEATLRSVLLQEYPNLEYMVFDGGSTDGAAEVVRGYAPWLAHHEIGADRGQSSAINRGFARATGEILGWVNSDDRLLPGALWRIAEAARRDPSCVAWVGGVRSVAPDGRLIFPKVPRNLTREQLADWGHGADFAQPGCFFSRKAFESAGPADESLHYAFDVDLWLRLAAQGRFAEVEGFLAEETIHPAAKTYAQRGKSLAELHLVQIRHGFHEVALHRMAEELQDYETLRRGTLVERARWQCGVALRSLMHVLRRSR
jgi:glycosyltransferase involved in cell wall biosynthesis